MINTLLKPMLLQKSDTVPNGDFIHQLKWDGFRCLLHLEKNQVRLFTRNQNECTFQFPEMKKIQLDVDSVILDGEMLVLDKENKPCFESVMTRFQSSNELTVRRLMKTLPAHFVAYDILYINGEDVTKFPLQDRLSLLYETVHFSPEISACESFEDGQDLFHSVSQMGLEGIVSKKKGSKYYLDMRSHDWIKVKNYQYDVVEISGIRKGEFAWSLLKEGKYVGTAEFVPPAERSAFYEISKQLIRGEDKEWIYLEPLIKCQVKFQCWTKTGVMRTPSFVKFEF